MTTSEPSRPVPASAPSRPSAPGTMRFFLFAYGLPWGCLLPGVLAQRGVIPGPVERYLPLSLPATFGPLLAAVLVTRFESGAAGTRALFRPLRTWRVGAIWYLVAL